MITHHKILHLEDVDSTNEFAKRLILKEDIGDIYIIISDHQTRGKGRLGRVWESPPGMGLSMSIILKPGVRNQDLVWCNFMTSVSVCETLRELTHLPFELKWPNDILIQSKKVCGILLETISKSSELFLIIGIGININQRGFPVPLDQTATSLFIETQMVWDRTLILRSLLAKFDENYANLDSDIFTRWKSLSGMLGRRITVIKGGDTFDATAMDVADDGALIIEKDGKTEKLYAGDVLVRIN